MDSSTKYLELLASKKELDDKQKRVSDSIFFVDAMTLAKDNELIRQANDFKKHWINLETGDLNHEYETRQSAIGQNGNSALHYELDDCFTQDLDNDVNVIDKERKETPVFSGVLEYFPDAIKAVSKCSLAGQKQHNLGDKLYWDKSKSTQHADSLVRHLIDHSENPIDTDDVLHLAKVAWRALALLQIYLDKSDGK